MEMSFHHTIHKQLRVYISRRVHLRDITASRDAERISPLSTSITFKKVRRLHGRVFQGAPGQRLTFGDKHTGEKPQNSEWRKGQSLFSHSKLFPWIGAGLLVGFLVGAVSSVSLSLPRDREPFFFFSFPQGEYGTSSLVCTQSAILWSKLSCICVRNCLWYF